MDSLVSTDWLATHLDAPDIRIVDATWFMPSAMRDARAEYAAAHIPGAVYFDIDEIADTTRDLPHMLPSPEKFSSRVRRLGLGDGVRIVVYDQGAWMAAPRVWWMFRAFGHEDIAVLDGGLAKWRAEERVVDDHVVMPRERHFTARLNTFLLRDLDQMRANLETGRELVIDVRAPGRFAGTAPEPREGLRSGHIPGSRNLPFVDLIDPETGRLLAPERLRPLFDEVGIAPGQAVVATCGSGVTTGVLALALHVAGYGDAAVYDGSWTEWGGRDDTPIEP